MLSPRIQLLPASCLLKLVPSITPERPLVWPMIWILLQRLDQELLQDKHLPQMVRSLAP